MLAYWPGQATASSPNLVYPGLLTAARQLGRRLLVAEADADGMTPAGWNAPAATAAAGLPEDPTLQDPQRMSAARQDAGGSAAACSVRSSGSPIRCSRRRAAGTGQPGAGLGVPLSPADQELTPGCRVRAPDPTR